MDKFKRRFRSIFPVLFVLALAGFFVVGVYAASTIGTNMSTTGTLLVNPASDSATSVRFQNAAGTNYFVANSTNKWIGVGAEPQTTFEVQGTSSASYFLTGNTIQVGGYASVAYSRFGTNATTYSGDLSTTNDLLISGNLEVDLKAYFDNPAEFQGTASASYLLTGNSLQVAGFATVAYSRFGTGTTGNTGEFDAANDLLITGSLEVDGKASVAGNFQTSGRIIADTTASHSIVGDLILTSALTVGATTASSSNGVGYTAQFVGPSTGTSSFYFGGSGVTGAQGSCFQLKSSTGAWIYMRFNQGATTPTLSTVRCHAI